jgi:hypothetical protein
MPSRSRVTKRFLSALILPLLLASCATQKPLDTRAAEVTSQHDTRPRSHSPLTHDEVAKARALAQKMITSRGASVSSATARVRPGRVAASNTNTRYRCSSGRLLQVKLIGKFPHTVTTGHDTLPGDPVPDFRVRAVIITADARSGRACLIGVQTGEKGTPGPLPNGTRLRVGNDGSIGPDVRSRR